MYLVKQLLIQNKYSNLVDKFEDLFSSHPNYPSLFAITDSLTLLGVENIAIKIPKEQFVELPENFLTVYKGDLVLLSKEDKIVTLLDEKGKKSKLQLNKFIDNWDQIVIALEPNPAKENGETKTPKWVLLGISLLLLILLSSFLNGNTFSSVLLLGSTLIGLALSILVLQEKLGVKTELVSKICNFNQESSCDSVIKSDQSQITKWLSFTDLPLLFFGTNFLSLLLRPILSVSIISVLSLLAIPFLIYSIWIQKAKIRKWCLLCLAISGIVFVQAFFFTFNSFDFNTSLFYGLVVYLFSAILVFSGWFLIKPLLEKEIKVSEEVKELKRFKRNFKIFHSLTKDVSGIENLENLNGIEFGNFKASTSLVLFLSPSCGHCHKAFQVAYELYNKNPESFYLKILFNINPENKQNKYQIIVQTLLWLNTVNTNNAKEALINWHIDNIDLQTWKEKWRYEANDTLVDKQILDQYTWCVENEFNYSPVKIINSKLFPNEYEITDLYFFMNDYEELNQEQIQQPLFG